MKRKMTSRLLAALVVCLLATVLFGVSASADTLEVQPCRECAKEGKTFTAFYATTEWAIISQTQCARVYACNNGHRGLTFYTDGTYRDTAAHVAKTNATCTACAVCGNCGEEYGAPLGHDVVIDKAVAPTCINTGLTEGKHCGRPGCGQVLVAQETLDRTDHTYDDGKVTKPTCLTKGYVTYTCTFCGKQEKYITSNPLSHWYDEWEPAGMGSHSAPCKREKCEHIKTTACVDWDFILMVPAEEETGETEQTEAAELTKEAEACTVCPICGALNDGGRLELVEDAKATPVTGWTPEGDMVVRFGELENGEKLMSVAFEYDARLTQCTGRTKFTVPAELLDGYQLMLLDEEGNETELELVTENDETTFELNFAALKNGSRIPVRILHLVPVEA